MSFPACRFFLFAKKICDQSPQIAKALFAIESTLHSRRLLYKAAAFFIVLSPPVHTRTRISRTMASNQSASTATWPKTALALRKVSSQDDKTAESYHLADHDLTPSWPPSQFRTIRTDAPNGSLWTHQLTAFPHSLVWTTFLRDVRELFPATGQVAMYTTKDTPSGEPSHLYIGPLGAKQTWTDVFSQPTLHVDEYKSQSSSNVAWVLPHSAQTS